MIGTTNVHVRPLSAINFLRMVDRLKPYEHRVSTLNPKTVNELYAVLSQVQEAPELAMELFALLVDRELNWITINLTATQLIEGLTVLSELNGGFDTILTTAFRFCRSLETA